MIENDRGKSRKEKKLLLTELEGRDPNEQKYLEFFDGKIEFLIGHYV